jgi:Restriction endonuclease
MGMDGAKTEVLIVTPGYCGSRIIRDLDLESSLKEELLLKFQPYIDALKSYKFHSAFWIDTTRGKMAAQAAALVKAHPKISHAIYLDPQTNEASFYCAQAPAKGQVSIHAFISQLDALGISATPIGLNYDEFFREVGLRRTAAELHETLETITATPRVLYRSHKVVPPRGRTWINEGEKEIFDYLRKRPHALDSIGSREFEYLIASIFRSAGFSVELTPQTRDGGFDFLAVENHTLLGESMILVECKRYSRHNRVGIGIVQRMLGTVNQYRATKGLIVTTSTFTRDAMKCAEVSKDRLTLQDYKKVHDWIKAISPHPPL